MKKRIAAFGALNAGSYRMFVEEVTKAAAGNNIDLIVNCAGSYPNEAAESAPGRPLRAEALQNEKLCNDLFSAVAADAHVLGEADTYCMPCMSMIGFHDGIERQLGRPIIRLSDALRSFYQDVPRLGVIHMRPAAQRVKEIFDGRAITPDESQAEALLAAEADFKRTGDGSRLEALMRDITVSFRDKGLSHVLFARADAPFAIRGPAGQVKNILINSYFDILAGYIVGKTE